MDFSLTDEQIEVRDLARKILGDLVTNDRLKEIEAGETGYDEQTWSALAESNLLGLAIAENCGGGGMDFATLAVFLQEVGRAVAPIPAWASLVLGGTSIERHGDDAQRAGLLPGIADGSTIVTAALTELEADDPLRPLTRARIDGDGFVLDGAKSTVPGAEQAHRILVPATTDDGHVGVFIVDPSSDGVEITRQITADQQPHGLVALASVRVGPEAVLGTIDADASVLTSILEHATAALCAIQLGVVERALEMTAEYARERVQFDRAIGSFQAVHQRAADAYINVECLRLAGQEACWRLSEGLPARDHVAVAKFWTAEGGQYAAYACQHLHGGVGIDVDYPLHRYFIWAIQNEHTLGGAHVQLERLGRTIAAEGYPAF